MKLHFQETLSLPSACDGLAILVAADNLDALRQHALLTNDQQAQVSHLIKAEVITGKVKTHYTLPATPDYGAVFVIGIGESKGITDEAVRRSVGGILGALKANKVSALVVDAPSDKGVAVVDAIVLGQYQYTTFKTTKDGAAESLAELHLLNTTSADAQAACRSALTMAQATNWARDLGNAPGNHMPPRKIADAAATLGDIDGVSVDILDDAKLKALKMGALLAVGQGSVEESRLIILKYTANENAPTVALVGKGISFDTGGISIKPSAGMQEMKFDMCGAAAVLGAFKAIAELKPSVNVICAVASAENMPGANAIKPGDIITSYSGKTIEIYNTDAEGRLALCDALAYVVEKYKPSKIINAATLTGACIVALGHEAAAVVSNSDDVCAELQTASNESGDRVWRLPDWDDYNVFMDGNDADVCNMSNGPARAAGTITAGCFLKRFVGDTPWAHVDIAGTSWGVPNVSYLNTKLATGYGVRLFAHWALNQT